MTLLTLCLSGVVLVVIAAVVRRSIASLARQQPDPAWQTKGTRRVFTGYDYDKARAARKRERAQLVARYRAAKSPAKSTAEIVSIDRRRA